MAAAAADTVLQDGDFETSFIALAEAVVLRLEGVLLDGGQAWGLGEAAERGREG